jgi:hypothetical protein
MPSGYPYSKSVRPGLFDRVRGAPAEAGGAESPRFGYTAFMIDAYAGLIPGWECSLSNGSCCAGIGCVGRGAGRGAVGAVGAAVARL